MLIHWPVHYPKENQSHFQSHFSKLKNIYLILSTIQDSLTITTNTGFSVPVICGLNTGQHMYLDIGQGSSDSATLAFTFSGTFSRYWDIKVTQIPCGVTYDPPNGCLQYHTGKF